jgi:GTP-binding protein HflX
VAAKHPRHSPASPQRNDRGDADGPGGREEEVRRDATTGLLATEPEQERAILVSAPLRTITPKEVDDHLEEMARLTDTAGAAVAGMLTQRIEAPHPRFFIGEGKVGELKDLVHERNAGLVIFDGELSPSQGRNLEQRLGTRIMDRAELILDIFATRARTAEAQMQVELAQLEYMLPRLKRMWTHLSRIRGGIGFRGPGETQLETDRRLIGRRIRDLRRKLLAVSQQRATRRKSRSGEYRAALVGYTNAGKSSVLRALSGSDVFVEDRLFATLDPATRSVDLAPGARVLVTDTVGFIRRLPHHLVASFRATLEEAVDADVLLHVIDAAHPGWEEQKQVVEGVLADLDLAERPVLLVFNKTDRLTHGEEQALRERVAALYGAASVYVSAVATDGLAELRAWLLKEFRARRPAVHVEIPAEDGESLAVIYREGEVLERRDAGPCIEIVARIPASTLGRLRRRPGIVVTAT